MKQKVAPAAFCAALLLAGCAGQKPVHAGAPLSIVPPATDIKVDADPAPAAIIQAGSGEFAAEPAQPPIRTDLDPQKLDIVFDRAPAAQVVQTLLSDYAGANVIIDPRVTGELTIRSQGQITAAELPDFLKASVHAIGLDLVDRGPNTYLLRPTPADASAEAPDLFRDGQVIPAGGVILPLKYVSATEMARLLTPLAQKSVAIQVESTREYLILTGPPAQVEALIKTAQLLDVDWLKGMSFGLVPLESSEPDTLIPELQKLFGGATGPIGSMVEFVPLPERHAILILAKRPARLEQARNWILQLDRADRGRAGRLHVLTVHSGDAAKLAETVTGLFDAKDAGAAKITADPSRNALIVQANAATFADIQHIVAELDKSPDQVEIEATIAEVTLTDDLKYGVEWFFNTRTAGTATFTGDPKGAITSAFPGFSYAFAGKYVQASLSALASKTKVEVLSSPILTTLDNQEAKLDIGDQVPIVTQSAVNLTTPGSAVVNSVEYRDTGIVLKVTPRIGADNTVTLEVSQEASEVAQTTTSGIDSPTIQQRKVQTKVMVADGQTIALGGLIQASKTRGSSGVPIAKDIPLLGMAFRSNSNNVRRTELIVFLTPKIIRSKDDAAAATAELKARLQRLHASRFITHALRRP